MNPFDLPGPQFGAFYLVAAGVVYVIYRYALHQAESGEPTALPLNDPYQIAYLRGGTRDAGRVAVLSLVDRGRLNIEGERIVTRGSTTGLAPIEAAIVECCAAPATVPALLGDRRVAQACEAYRAPLEELGLVPDRLLRDQRWLWFTVAASVLLGIGLVKLYVALERGRTNVGFLVLLMAFALWLLITAARRRRTALGDAVLSDLRRLFHGLRGQVAPAAEGGATSDAMLLAAVFGVSALPSLAFGEIKRVFAKADQGGSSCGSSGGGDGGCGGGGGGCGGCGS
jgi:uncharacterized protein (TIGR04222 family)